MEIKITKDNGATELIAGVTAMELCVARKDGSIGYTCYLSIHDHLRSLIVSTRALGTNSVAMARKIPDEDKNTKEYFDKMAHLLGEYAGALILLEKAVTEIEDSELDKEEAEKSKDPVKVLDSNLNPDV